MVTIIVSVFVCILLAIFDIAMVSINSDYEDDNKPKNKNKNKKSI